MYGVDAADPIATILVVDDDKLDQMLLRAHLAMRGYALEFADNGEQAMNILREGPQRFDVVLLDRSMPRMSGIEVLEAMKEDPRLRTLPVIMQTAAAQREHILEGIRAGAYYYLTKPYDPETLQAMVASATRDYREFKRLRKEVARGLDCLALVQDARLVIRSLDQARDVAAVLANCCPDPPTVVIGLTELLVNAIEHGNLGITYDEKTELNVSGTWQKEVERRLALPENAAKRVDLRIERTGDVVRFTIRDEGPGFDWSRFMEVDPQRAFDTHGRGIAISRAMSFDSIEFRGSGSEVVATVRL